MISIINNWLLTAPLNWNLEEKALFISCFSRILLQVALFSFWCVTACNYIEVVPIALKVRHGHDALMCTSRVKQRRIGQLAKLRCEKLTDTIFYRY